MKKALKTVGKILLGFLILFIVFLLIMTIWNKIAMNGEKDIINDTPGQLVEIDGHNMSIYTEGPVGQTDRGVHTIVFMSGWGTPSPIYDFRPLYEKLSNEYRIVVIEKFGYGFSDIVDSDRDFDTILRQDREVLAKQGIEGPYVLCAHSLSGLEAALWSQKYPDEVEAVVGLDMAMADYPGYADLKNSTAQHLMMKLNELGGFVGINRLLVPMNKPVYCRTDEELKQLTAIACKTLGNKTVNNENDAIEDVCDEINSAARPSAPTLQFLSGESADDKNQLGCVEAYIAASSYGRSVQLDCGHYVHHYESEKIGAEIKEFISALDK